MNNNGPWGCAGNAPPHQSTAKEVITVTKKEKQNQARRIAEALDRLPEGKAEFILGYAEGVIAMAAKQDERKAS